MSKLLAVLAGALLAIAAAPSTGAGLAIDEATYPGANGDYNNLLSPPLLQAVVFDLPGGTSTFAGTFGTPGDAGDTILIQLGSLATLTAVRVTFATNAGLFDPVGVNQKSELVLDTTSSSNPVPLLALALDGKPDAPIVFSSAPLALGAELYNVTLRTELLALSSAGHVGYQIAFDVTAIPEPSSYALLLAGGSLLVLLRRRRASV